MEKSAVLAPIPRASVTTAMIAKAGALMSMRRAKRMSWARAITADLGDGMSDCRAVQRENSARGQGCDEWDVGPEQKRQKPSTQTLYLATETGRVFPGMGRN